MPKLYDLQGNELSWEQLEERRQVYYAWKDAQEQFEPPEFFKRRYPGRRGYTLVRR